MLSCLPDPKLRLCLCFLSSGGEPPGVVKEEGGGCECH
jgi:hypothetical protein